MDVVFLIARILFALLFLFSAMGHLMQSAAMAQYAGFKGAPGGRGGVIASGITMGVGALMIVLGVYGDVGALLVAATLIPISLFMHAFWKEEDAQAKQADQIQFNKNVGLIGGALALFLLFAVQDAGLGLTLTDSVLHLS
jgi:uncharacterized membrane protein YphA (DoxX/SURF4 family)